MRDLGKLIVAKGLKKFPKVQKITQSGYTGSGWGVFPLLSVKLLIPAAAAAAVAKNILSSETGQHYNHVFEFKYWHVLHNSKVARFIIFKVFFGSL